MGCRLYKTILSCSFDSDSLLHSRSSSKSYSSSLLGVRGGDLGGDGGAPPPKERKKHSSSNSKYFEIYYNACDLLLVRVVRCGILNYLDQEKTVVMNMVKDDTTCTKLIHE
jgi:hypothetical protein